MAHGLQPALAVTNLKLPSGALSLAAIAVLD